MELFALEAVIDLDTDGFLAGLDVAEDRFETFVDRVSSYKMQLPQPGYAQPRFSKNASAMSAGRIFDRPTAFDYLDGAWQVAGDAGPEAVVGVNSLERMIESAVRAAAAGSSAAAPREGGRDVTVVLEMDRQQFARAVYRSNNEETQRVGTRLSTGGVL